MIMPCKLLFEFAFYLLLGCRFRYSGFHLKFKFNIKKNIIILSRSHYTNSIKLAELLLCNGKTQVNLDKKMRYILSSVVMKMKIFHYFYKCTNLLTSPPPLFVNLSYKKLIRGRHIILCNSSASLNRQYTSFRKISNQVSIIFYVINAWNH